MITQTDNVLVESAISRLPVLFDNSAALILDLPDEPKCARLDVAAITHSLKQSFPATLTA